MMVKNKWLMIHVTAAALFLAGILLIKVDSLLAVSLISCTFFIYVAVSVKRSDKGKKMNRDFD